MHFFCDTADGYAPRTKHEAITVRLDLWILGAERSDRFERDWPGLWLPSYTTVPEGILATPTIADTPFLIQALNAESVGATTPLFPSLNQVGVDLTQRVGSGDLLEATKPVDDYDLNKGFGRVLVAFFRRYTATKRE